MTMSYADAMKELSTYERMPDDFRALIDVIWVRPGAVPQCREMDCWEAEWSVGGFSVVLNMDFETEADDMSLSIFALTGEGKMVFSHDFKDVASVTDKAVQQARGELERLAPQVEGNSIQQYWDREFERRRSGTGMGVATPLLDGAL